MVAEPREPQNEDSITFQVKDGNQNLLRVVSKLQEDVHRPERRPGLAIRLSDRERAAPRRARPRRTQLAGPLLANKAVRCSRVEKAFDPTPAPRRGDPAVDAGEGGGGGARSEGPHRRRRIGEVAQKRRAAPRQISTATGVRQREAGRWGGVCDERGRGRGQGGKKRGPEEDSARVHSTAAAQAGTPRGGGGARECRGGVERRAREDS